MPRTQRLKGIAALLASVCLANAAQAQDTVPAGTCGGNTTDLSWVAGSAVASDLSTAIIPFDVAASIQTARTYAFRLSSPSDVRVEAMATSLEGDPLIELLDAAGTTIISDDDGGDLLNSQAMASLEPGTYCLNVTSFGGTPYEASVRIGRGEQEALMLASGSSPDVMCLPDTPALDLGVLGSGPLDSTGSAVATPFLRFNLLEPTSVTVTATNPDADPVLRLFDAAGQQLAENDDFDGLNSRIDMVDPLPAGTYCAGLTVYGDETLPVDVSVSPYDEAAYFTALYESADAAPPLDGSYPVTDLGLLETSLRQDIRTGSAATWIAFEVPAEGLVLIDAVSASNGDPYVVLFDDFGRRVAEDDDSGGDLNAQLASRVSRGVYLLAVYEVSSAGSSNRTRIGIERYVPAR